jgi:hypothetical protein
MSAVRRSTPSGGVANSVSSVGEVSTYQPAPCASSSIVIVYRSVPAL